MRLFLFTCFVFLCFFTSFGNNDPENGKNAPIHLTTAPDCAAPSQISLLKATQTSLFVAWSSEGDNFQVAVTPKDRPSPSALLNPVNVNGVKQYLFTGLKSNTSYSVFVRTVCTQSQSGTVLYSTWEKVNFQTLGLVSSDCYSDTTFFQITNVSFNGFSIGMTPLRNLRYNGRRLLVRYRLLTDPAELGLPAQASDWHERILYDEDNLRIEDVFKIGAYEVFIKQLRDGEYTRFTRSCPEIGPLYLEIPSSRSECGVLESVDITCAGAGYLNLKFNAPADGIDGTRYLVALKPHGSSIENWKFYYHFSGEIMTLEDLDPEVYDVSVFTMVGKSGFNFDLLCSEYIVGQADLTNNNIHDVDGDGIPDGCDTNDSDGPLGDLDFDGIRNEDETEDTVNPFPQMPELSCGPAIVLQPLDSTNMLMKADSGQIFFINGFPILLTKVTGGSGLFSGEGITGLPFKNQFLRVEFNNVSVNSDNIIVSGTVNGISENLNNYPALPLDTITFGEGRFCQPIPEEEGFDENGIWIASGNPYNPLGFGANGTYIMPPYDGSQPGLPYDPQFDPNGFNSAGTYLNTGSPFGPNGCNQIGFDANGQACNNNPSQTPYYWLNNNTNLGPTTAAGLALANELRDTLRPLVLASLHQKELLYLDSIQVVKVNCDLIRDTMRGYFNDLNYTNTRDRVFIFGPNDDWFREGMSKNFKEEPKPLGIVLDRNPKEELLERTHINLYHCDVNQMRYQGVLDILKELQVEPGISDIVQHLKDLIQRFTTGQASEYSNIANLKVWITSKVDSAAVAEYKLLNGITSVDEESNGKGSWSAAPRRSDKSKSGYLASVDNHYDNDLLIDAENTTWSDIAFEFAQGWESVNGVDRAFFLEGIDKARVKNEKILGGGNNEGSFMPLKISKDILGRTYTLYLDNISFTPDGAKADIYAIISTTPSPDRIVFKALDVPFGSFGFTGETKLFLGTNISVTISNPVRLNILGNNNTYVAFDCDGFSGMSVEGEVEFCRNYVIPLEPGSLEPKEDPDASVKGHFITQMPAWGEFVVDLSIDPFALTNYDSVKWVVNGVVFDFSSSITPATVKFPSNYVSPFVQNNHASPQWRGFYMKNLTVVLPKQFGKNDGSTISVGAKDVIFDDTGLTGKVFASPILDICDGDLDGWAFSIDTFALQAVSNKLTGFEISGKVHIPIFSGGGLSDCPPDSACVRYSAVIMPGNIYSFSISPLGSTYTVDMWKGKVVLNSNSEIEIKVQDGRFLATANLSGRVTIDGQLSNNFYSQISDIAFENVIIRNKAPYFETGIWSVPNVSAGVGFGGFAIFVNNTEMTKNGDTGAALAFDAGIVVLDQGGNFLTVDGGFRLKGKLHVMNKRQRWLYDGFAVDDVSIDASFPGVRRVHGALHFFGQDEPHQTFGKGFRGEVDVEFTALPVSIKAVGVFGKMGTNASNEYRYFMIDALAEFDPGINMGALQLIGFGGGASYNMERVGDLDTGLPADIANEDPSTIELGTSLSGLVYVPNDDYELSLSATVVLALAKKEALNINATFGISFYNNGGVGDIYFKGTGKFMDALDFSGVPAFEDSGNPTVDAAISAFVNIKYEFEAKRLTGTFRVNINAQGILEGEGIVDMLFEPGRWYVNIGKPTAPVYVNLTIPGIDIKAGQVAYYFDIGKDIPAFPGLPANVASLTGLGNIVANESLRRTGSGFATGLKFELNTGDLEFLMFYAHFAVGAGFDLMMQDYGEATCANLNGEKLGINGWYASGQMWAFIEGSVGIKVHLWGQDRSFQILDLAAAAALQAKFPNPFYARGAVGGRYRILGGVVKGDCRFDITLGQECEIQGGSNPNQDQLVIYELSPADSVEGVNTLAIPRAVFNVPLDQDLNDGTDTWRASLVDANIISNGLILGSQKTLSAGNTVLEVKTSNILPANKWIRFKIKVKLLKNGQFDKFEEREVAFKTDGAPKTIPASNIELAYPFDRQYNFYKNEYQAGTGHIVLKFGQPDLLTGAPPSGYSRSMRLTKVATGATSDFPYTYNADQKKISFDLPESFLEGNKVYKLEIINKPSSTSGGAASAAPPSETEYGSEVSVVPPVLYTMHFRVSQYNTFAAKVEAMKSATTVNTYGNGWIRAETSPAEPLDFYEINGGDNGDPLVSTSLNLNTNSWFTENKNYLRCAYNYYYDMAAANQCKTIYSFTGNPNVFDQQNFSNLPVGFDNPVSHDLFRLSSEGNLPENTSAYPQHLDLTVMNGYGAMWLDLKQDLWFYIMNRYNGYDDPNSASCDIDALCPSGSPQSCRNVSDALNGNSSLTYIANTLDVPQPASNTKFPVTLQYTVPGHGVTTSKVLEIVKP